MTGAVERAVRSLVEEWIDGLPGLFLSPLMPGRDVCVRCARSPYIAALGPFAVVPHGWAHPLIVTIDARLEAYAARRWAEVLDRLREEWLDNVDLVEGEAPSIDYLEAAIDVHDESRAAYVLLDVEAQAAALDAAVATIEHVVAEREAIACALVTGVVGEVSDALDSGDALPKSEADGLDDRVAAAITEWLIWLPTIAWRPAPRGPLGCAICSSVLPRLGAPHLAAHRLATAVLAIADAHVERFHRPRIEPPEDGALGDARSAVIDRVAAVIAEHAAVLRRAVELHARPAGTPPASTA